MISCSYFFTVWTYVLLHNFSSSWPGLGKKFHRMDVCLYLIQGTSVYSSKYVHIYGQCMAPSMNSYLECFTTSLDNQINFTMNHIQPPPPKYITLGIYTLLHYSLLWYQPKYSSSTFTTILIYITGLFCATLQHSPEYIDI